MYDTVNFWIDKADISGGNPFGVLPYLSEITERQNERQGYSCTGKLKDYIINVNENGISLKGSLAKSFFENNIITLTRQTTEQAIEMLSDNLHTDVRNAKITRIDISTVIPTKRPPSDYYPYLGIKPYFTRLQSTPDTLYYNNHQKQIIFYDKIKEAKVKNVQIPDVYQNSNLFRYELRYTKHLKRQLNINLTASKLYETEFYRSVIWSWYTEFKSIQKIKENNFMIEENTTLKKAKESILAYALQQLGAEFIDQAISEAKAKKALNNRSDYTRLKADLNKMVVAKFCNNSELINALENDIFSIARHAR